MIPKVLVVYHHRPMSAGLFYRFAFRQAGCEAHTAGPGTPHVYGRPNGQDHTFDPDDYMPPDFEIRNEPIDATTLVESVRAQGFAPDLLMVADQYDPLVVTGEAPPGTAYVHLAIENWNADQRARYENRRADAEFYCIAHSNEAPLPPNAEWVVFGADPFVHPNFGTPRDKWVCQIGTAYEPRPMVWDALRALLDGAPAVGKAGYLESLHETEHTLFGRTPSYRGLAEAYNRSLCALSCSNSDFVPMRAVEAMAMGCVLVSDDVSDLRKAFGAPWNPDDGGCWIATERTPEAVERAIRLVAKNPDIYEQITQRACALTYSRYTYAHTGRRMLAAVGLRGATRMV